MRLLKKPIFIIAVAAVSFVGLSFIADRENAKSISEQGPSGLSIGDPAPALSFEGPDGKTRSLSDLKGKVVLIDFWASWCRPCRAENPNVVKTYNAYKSAEFKSAKGFEVFSVSLDRNKTDWVKAIEKDGLVWDGHVSDLKFWQSAGARAYNVNSIPATFLIDEKGVIIAKNLRGNALESTLKKLLK